MKYAAAITLYNPTEEVINNLIQYEEQFDYIFVYDNSQNELNNKLFSKINIISNLVYMYNGINEGLPKAYNYMLLLAKKMCVDFMCTLDQDSKFSNRDIENLKKYIEKLSVEKLNEIGIIAPHINYQGKIKRNNRIVNIKWVITSGAFIHVNLIFQNNIMYDEYYFIDKFDIDFCKQVINKNLKIQICYFSVLSQRLGTDSFHYKFNHNPIRHYYMSRNRLYFNKKYYRVLSSTLLSLLQTLRHIMLVLCFEEEKISKIRSINKGVLSYYKELNLEKKNEKD